jgi:2-methylisocitrate lyase-like PEP mutase family enzyme
LFRYLRQGCHSKGRVPTKGIEARESKDLIIVARTDARAALGLDEAIERGNAYKRAGADVIFVEAPISVEELKKVADEIDAPLVANMIEDGITPTLPAQELLKLGLSIWTGTCTLKKDTLDAYRRMLWNP